MLTSEEKEPQQSPETLVSLFHKLEKTREMLLLLSKYLCAVTSVNLLSIGTKLLLKYGVCV